LHGAVDEVDFLYTVNVNRCAIHLLFRDAFARRQCELDFCHPVIETEVDLLVITSPRGGVQKIEGGIPATLVGNVDIRVDLIRIPCLNASLGGTLPVDGVFGICWLRLARGVHHVFLGIGHLTQQHPDFITARPRILASGAGLRLCQLRRQL